MTIVVGLNVIGQQVITAVEQKVDIDIYFYDYVAEKDILEAQDFIKQLPETQTVQYTSSAAALKEFTDSHKDDASILASLSEIKGNVLPASLNIKAKDLGKYQVIVSAIQSSKYQEMIDRTDYSNNADLIARIHQITRIANQTTLGVSAAFLFISIIVIFNTFRITIYSYREEIGIMKLVGATNQFIRTPFIVEGVILGALAATITLGLSGIVLWLSNDAIHTFFTGYNFSLVAYTGRHIWQFIFGELIGAIVLSVTFTIVAISRYLKV